MENGKKDNPIGNAESPNAPQGDKKPKRQPSARLPNSPLTAFRANANDHRVVDLAHRIRRVCRRILGVTEDDEMSSVITDALRKLPKSPNSLNLERQVSHCNYIRNRIVHRDYHATLADVRDAELAWKGFKKAAAAFLDVVDPPNTVVPGPQAPSQKDRVASASPRTLWGRVLRSPAGGKRGSRDSLEALLGVYESSIMHVFRRLTNSNEVLAKAKRSAFCESLQRADRVEPWREFTSFRRFLAAELWRGHHDKSTSALPSDGQLTEEQICEWLTQARARQLYLDALGEACDRCPTDPAGDATRRALNGYIEGKASLQDLRRSSPSGRQAASLLLGVLEEKVQEEIYVPAAQDLQAALRDELAAFFNALCE